MIDVTPALHVLYAFSGAIVVAMACGLLVAYLTRKLPRKRRMALTQLTFICMLIVGGLFVTSRVVGV